LELALPQPLSRKRGRGVKDKLAFANQPLVFLHQLFLAFCVRFIEWDAVYRADLLALWFVKVADAFGAAGRVDDVDFFPCGNGLVGALGFADITVDAVVSDF